MTDTFDLEQEILRCWSVTNDLGEVLEDLENAHVNVDTAIEAFRVHQKFYELRFERCWRLFELHAQTHRDLRQRCKELESVIEQQKLVKSTVSKQQKKVDQ